MNRFAKSGSRLFFAVAWFFVGSLFADGANLDDLFSSNLVIHDDEDVAAGCAQSFPHSDEQAPLKHPASPVRVIVDQDSPSLAADTDAATLVNATGLPPTDSIGYETVLTADAIYIKLRTLLI